MMQSDKTIEVSQYLLDETVLYNFEVFSKIKNAQKKIIIALDISGSMAGKTIKYVKNSLKILVKMLHEVQYTDITLLLFNHECRIKTFSDRNVLNNYIDQICPEGGTDFKKVLITLQEFILTNKSQNISIVFFTDGCDGYSTQGI